jgi:hypothetical protein
MAFMIARRRILFALLGVAVLVGIGILSVPFLLSDRATANRKALLRNLAQPSSEGAVVGREYPQEAIDASRPELVSPGLPSSTQTAISSLHVGMNGSDAVLVMRPVSLDWGRIYYGGTGAGRLYFQISSTQQLWLDSGGSLSHWKVTSIGVGEPKTQWTHHSGDSIDVIAP